MSGDDPPDGQAVYDALADPDCRDILAALDEPLAASEVVTVCDLPQTSTYRKLDRLSAAGLVEERTELRVDGNHATTYVRDCTGVLVAIDEAGAFDVELLREEGTADGTEVGDRVADDRTADERLARLWSRVGEEL